MVKEISKCGQLWTLGIEKCLWNWGSMRLIEGVPLTEGAQNGVSSEGKNKKREGEEKKKGRKRREEKEKKERDYLDPGERGLSHFGEDFLQI